MCVVPGRLGLVTLAVILMGCGSDDPQYQGPTRDIEVWVRVLEIQPSDPPPPSQPYASIIITQDGVRIAGAVVTIDGVSAPPHPLEETQYGAVLDSSAGDVVELVVTYDDIVITGTCCVAGEIVPGSPNMADGPHDSTQDIPLNWTFSSFVPERVRLYIVGGETVAGDEILMMYDATAVDAVIPAGVMKSGRLVHYQLAADNESSSLTVVAAPGSIPARLMPESRFYSQWSSQWIEYETQ
jgi:hypothetical protein